MEAAGVRSIGVFFAYVVDISYHFAFDNLSNVPMVDLGCTSPRRSLTSLIPLGLPHGPSAPIWPIGWLYLESNWSRRSPGDSPGSYIAINS